MKYLIITLSLTVCATMYAQDWMFQTTIGTMAYGFDFEETEEGFIAIGTDTISSGDGYQTIITAKFSRCGELIWEQYIDPPYETNDFSGVAITQAMDDNYVGWGIIGYDSIYLFKMDPAGDILWDKLIPSDAYLVQYRPVAAIHEDSEGNLFLMTKSKILKLDEVGDVIWEKNILTDVNMFCIDFQIDELDDLILIGKEYPSGNGKLFKCNSDGDILFEKYTEFNSLSLLLTQDAIVVGGELDRKRVIYFFDMDGEFTSMQELPFYLDDPWLVEHEDELKSNVASIALLDNGNFALRTNQTSILYPEMMIVLYTTVLEYNPDIEEIISEVLLADDALTPLAWEYGGDILSTFDGGYAVLGAERLDVLEYQLAMWKFKNNCDLRIADVPLLTDVLVYPNPASDFIQIESNEGIAAIRIYNLAGVLVFSGLQTSNYISIGDFQSGMYFVEIETVEQQVVLSRFVKS